MELRTGVVREFPIGNGGNPTGTGKAVWQLQVNPTAVSHHQSDDQSLCSQRRLSMRIFVTLVVSAAIVAMGYEAVTVFAARSSTRPSPNSTGAVNTLSPHDIHLNYKGMEKLPVHDVKDAN
jgi:hypothetical protein